MKEEQNWIESCFLSKSNSCTVPWTETLKLKPKKKNITGFLRECLAHFYDLYFHFSCDWTSCASDGSSASESGLITRFYARTCVNKWLGSCLVAEKVMKCFDFLRKWWILWLCIWLNYISVQRLIEIWLNVCSWFFGKFFWQIVFV